MLSISSHYLSFCFEHYWICRRAVCLEIDTSNSLKWNSCRQSRVKRKKQREEKSNSFQRLSSFGLLKHKRQLINERHLLLARRQRFSQQSERLAPLCTHQKHWMPKPGGSPCLSGRLHWGVTALPRYRWERHSCWRFRHHCFRVLTNHLQKAMQREL